MTEQEARKIIGGITLDRVSEEETRALGIACKALEKQIPKKLKKLISYDMDIGFEVIHTQRGFCSSCGQRVIEEKHDFCPRCGQAIKWDD